MIGKVDVWMISGLDNQQKASKLLNGLMISKLDDELSVKFSNLPTF
jgi:hypothetical protein